jgi:hypothetical protein
LRHYTYIAGDLASDVDGGEEHEYDQLRENEDK